VIKNHPPMRKHKAFAPRAYPINQPTCPAGCTTTPTQLFVYQLLPCMRVVWVTLWERHCNRSQVLSSARRSFICKKNGQNSSLKRSFWGGGQGRFVVKDVLVHLRSYTISFQENCRVQCFIVLGGVRRVHFQKTSTKAPNNPKGR